MTSSQTLSSFVNGSLGDDKGYLAASNGKGRSQSRFISIPPLAMILNNMVRERPLWSGSSKLILGDTKFSLLGH